MSDNDKKPPSKVDEYIDQNLKRVFADLEQDEIPDRFKALLDKLRAQDQESSSEQ